MGEKVVSRYPKVPDSGAADKDWVDWANEWPTVAPLGLRCTDLRCGAAEFEVESDPFVSNPNGAVNGGIIAAMADQVMGLVGARSCEPGNLPSTGSLHVHFHRPVRAPVRLIATQLPGGRRIQFIEVQFVDAAGLRCASAQGTMVSVPAVVASV